MGQLARNGPPMKLSVVTVAYNAAATLGATCTSVAAAAAAGIDLEHHVVDGGSTDGTRAVIAAHEAGLASWVSEPDGGVYEAMNKGLQRATGEFVAFLNADDVYADAAVLGRMLEVLTESGADAAYADLEVVDGGGRVVRVWRGGRYREGAFRRGWMPPHPTFIARRTALLAAGGFNTTFKISADYELMLRLIYVEGIQTVYHPEVLVRMRAGGLSNASWRGRWRAHREDWKAWRINGLRPAVWTLPLKPLRKVSQFKFRPFTLRA